MNDSELLTMLYKWRDEHDGRPTLAAIHRDAWRIAKNVGQVLTTKDVLAMLERLRFLRRVVKDGDTWRAIPQPLAEKIEKATQAKLF